VPLLSKNVAVLGLERDLAALRSRPADPAGGPLTPIGRDLRRLRELVERRLNAAIRTLADVRRVETSSIETTSSGYAWWDRPGPTLPRGAGTGSIEAAGFAGSSGP
jgi:hypothetical protein